MTNTHRVKEKDGVDPLGERYGKYDFIDCVVGDEGGRWLAPEDFVVDYMNSGSVFQLQHPDTTGDGIPEAWKIHPDGSNTSIPPFYPHQ